MIKKNKFEKICKDENIELTKSLLEKTPDVFIVNFVREGLVNYLQKYIL